MEDVASSRRMILLFRRRALARQMSCFCPREMLLETFVIWVLIPSGRDLTKESELELARAWLISSSEYSLNGSRLYRRLPVRMLGS